MSDNDSAVGRQMHAAFQRAASDVRPGLEYGPWDELPEQERRLAVRACWEAANTRDFLDALMIEVAELDQVIQAVAREKVIRSVMAETGEPREIVAEMVDANRSMDQEAVLDLTEGEPTTLRAALERYLEEVRQNGVPAGAEYDLEAILAYPFPQGDGAHPDVITVRKADGSVAVFLSGTVDGIRPHLPRTRKENELARKVYEQMPGPDLGKLLRELES